MEEDNNFVTLSEEERSAVIRMRRKKGREIAMSPPGIGTGRIWAHAKLKNKKWIDDATFIEEEGK